MLHKTKRATALLLLVVVFVLASCGPTETVEPTPTPEPTEPPTEEPTAPTGEQPPTEEPASQPGSCEVVPLQEVDVPPVNDTDWSKGASEEDAEITIIEYSDFECPGCGAMATALTQYLEENPNARLIYRHFPLSFHTKALLTAEAAEAAGAQDKFWEMHDLLFERSSEWQPLTVEEAREKMSEYAAELDLDVEAFDEALDEDTYLPEIEGELEEAREMGLPGTPSFIFDNILYPSNQLGLSYQGLEVFPTLVETKDDQYAEQPPTVVEEGASYEATVSTTEGDIVVELTVDSAPTHVNNFVFLAEEGWYEDSDFFFVQENFAALAGDPTNTGVGYPGYYCIGEAGPFEGAGLVGMLPNGQFFFTLGTDATELSGEFPLVGEVVEGQEVLDAIAATATETGEIEDPVVVESVTVTEK